MWAELYLRAHEGDSQEGDAPMDAFQSLAIVVVAATAFWVYLKLKERIELLEHEVRWLRTELEALKPREIKSAYD